MLTAKQHQTYQFIQDYITQHGYAPTEAEIAKGIGICSRGVVHRYVTALAEAGYIKIVPGFRRNIELTQQEATGSITLPILGTIAAGRPIEAIENHQVFDVTEALLKPNLFILKVKGDSMIGDSICDGDYIICERADTARSGEIIIALIDQQEATLKRLKHSNGQIMLIPSNVTLAPMVYDAKRVMIQGIFKGLIRLTT